MNGHQFRYAVSENTLLDQKSIVTITQQIQDLAGLPEQHFHLFYKLPLGRFLALTQHCTEDDITSHLLSVAKSLKLRRSVILPIAADAEVINKQKDLWTYVVFVGSLMFNSAELIAQKVVYQKDKIDQPKKWSPFAGPMPPGSKYGNYGKLEVSKYSANAFLTLVFCPQCIAWIYRDPIAFNAALELAHTPVLQARIGQLVTNGHPESDNGTQPTLQNSPQDSEVIEIDKDNTPEAPILVPFTTWLKDAIENTKFPQLLCETIDGYAISDPEIFIQYCNQEDTSTSYQDERSSFLALGIHKTGPKIKFSSGRSRPAIFIPDLLSLS